ncbi:MAG TPA: glutamate synthase large subunit [Verrucomicrobiales bacterium]|nr:glutamate synthase large subunit [Verrucomicrobiales bacterium]
MKHFDVQLPGNTLHRLDLERDSCGVGLVAAVDGRASRRILRWGLTSVCNVVHRGAVDADQKTGDGAGVCTGIPHAVFQSWLREANITLDRPSDLGAGVFFLSRTKEKARDRSIALAEEIASRRGLRILGWREVPVNPRELGKTARSTMPDIRHFLVARPEGLAGDDFERQLFLVRREICLRAEEEGIPSLYIPSFSHRTIVYKALLVATALEKFYLDLQDPAYETALCLYHQRFSTNTFPTWSLCQPFRMLAHNGEINTLRGNRNWLRARESDFANAVWGDDVRFLSPLLDPRESDSASLDSALELLVLSGRSVTHAMAMLVPPAWRIDPTTSKEEQDFYSFHRCFAEPWDGPAALAFTDGKTVAACLDRNGLRPARYKLTRDGVFTLGSEVGVVEIDDADVIEKGRLAPGEMIAVDTVAGRVLHNKEIRQALAARQPYGTWLAENRVELSSFVADEPLEEPEDLDVLGLSQQQVAAGCNLEEIEMALTPMVLTGQEAVYSMGDDIPLSVLSTQPRLLSTYFKQLFAQVTNPPIDPIRERLVMSLGASLGHERNWLEETPAHAKILNLDCPILWEHQLRQLSHFEPGFPAVTLDTTWPVATGAAGIEPALDRLCAEAEEAVDAGTQILILSDRSVSHERVALPALMAVGAVHHHLSRTRKRMRCSLILDTAEARDPHQTAVLFAYGVTAVCPYLGFATVREMLLHDTKKRFEGLDYLSALRNYRGGLEKGLLKIMSKMGISVLNSYQGAQIFEAVGLHKDVIDRCFAGTHSQISGAGFPEIAQDCLQRHSAAFSQPVPESGSLDLGDPGYNRYRREGERHAVHANVIKNFHTFVRTNDPAAYEEYVEQIRTVKPLALHDLFELVPLASGPVPLSEIEPVEDIRIRFTTAAMSLGALSPEAHETLAIAMNEIGGKSDSGEGGEDPERFKRRSNGEWANSKIKQVASGRFGVTAEYLASAEELEIKMAQGAKPGEGGQLPGHKVNNLIARLRRTQPGVQLISPPPHHDIYSIEDLAQLIHDLKEVNPRARICVKLVAETGVGTIAAGVAKANADIILISGHEGGTGASPLSSIKHAGLPWELGLAETQQVLMLNGLRDRVTLRTDGGLRTGMDIIHAALLGAEEFNFGTIALIAMGCVYVRRCHLNTCPVGIASQDPKYRAKFKGQKEHVINFFNSVAEECRRIMASLGVRRMDDLIGRTRFLRQRHVPDHPKANLIDLSRVLRDVGAEREEDMPRRCLINRNDGTHPHPLDDRIIQHAAEAIRDRKPIRLAYRVRNTNRNIGTKLAGEIAYSHGDHGLPKNCIQLDLHGSAGQSLGTFLCEGIRIVLTGEANDYVGKGMCGGEIVVRPPANAGFAAAANSIIGNTVLYGATGGRLFAAGRAGERFCVRLSGATGVVEGCGDHGCEYMTNGIAVILGPTGKNFGAGMSGGIAYVYDENGDFEQLYNPDMIRAGRLSGGADETELQKLIYDHLECTESVRAKELLADWESSRRRFFKVEPKLAPIALDAEPDEAAQPAAAGR